MPRAELARGDRGQILVLTGVMLMVLVGFTGVAIDVAWYHLNTLRIQRAADAAALAGVVYLPGNVPGAFSAARSEATKNGYTDGVNAAVVTVTQDPINARLLIVTVKGSAQPFFARFFGVNAITAQRRARAEFILPVPMGSPQNYFGIQNLCADGDTPPACLAVTSATGSGPLASQGYWGAVETRGAQRGSGDAYSTGLDSAQTGGINAGYDPLGYSYIVEFPAGTVNGKVWIYDPIFCATGRRNSGTTNRLGAADVWLSTSLSRLVTTEFKLWDMNGTPYSTTDDLLVASDGGLFTNMDNADRGLAYRGNQSYSLGNTYNGGSSTDCQSSPYHHAWWLLASGLGQGDYRLQVTTSSGTTQQNAVNNFGIQATADAGTGLRVYGQSRMAIFASLPGTAATFYLAQVDAVHAGKTLEIKLFDPGDFQNTFLRIKQPNTTGYTDASFTFTATAAACCSAPTSGGPVTVIQTSTTSNWYNNQWLTLQIALPTTYTAPTPPGEPGPGWWKIEYTTGGTGQDVTTWEVNIRGNPVHLIVP